MPLGGICGVLEDVRRHTPPRATRSVWTIADAMQLNVADNIGSNDSNDLRVAS